LKTRHPRDEAHFVADYAGGSLPFVPLTVPLAEARRLFMTDFSEPSSVRVFAKSLHWLAAGWTAAIAWLWLAGLRQHLLRRGAFPDDYGAATVIGWLLSAAAIEGAAILIVRWTGRAPRAGLERREWRHAFWWSVVPNALLLATVYVMIESTR
jgi:hypothetical protein